MISEVYNEGYKFCQDMRIPCYDTDAAFCLKPASFMDMAQEIAYWAAQALGFGYDDLQRHHTAWVLSRMHFHCETLPMWRDPVVLKTWHKGADGLFFLRDFQLLTPGGGSLVRATSSWLVMDMETRRLVRGGDVLQLVDSDTRVEEDAMRIDSYHGVDRGFILRFLNAGTVERESRYGKRGSLRPRNWFGVSSAYQMDAAADEVAQEIENMLQQEFHQI